MALDDHALYVDMVCNTLVRLDAALVHDRHAMTDTCRELLRRLLCWTPAAPQTRPFSDDHCKVPLSLPPYFEKV